MPRINLVIPCWGGDRRGGHQDIVYCRKAINQLRVLRHNLNQITLCVAEEQQSKPFHDYINSLENETQLPIKVFKRKNVGLSYGAFSEVFDTYDNAFDYYILMEDDYYFCHHEFDAKLVELFEKQNHCGFLCGFVSVAAGKRWAGNCNGIASYEALAAVKKSYGKLPYDETLRNNYSEESGQISFSESFERVGFNLADITEEFEILHYYWQHMKVKPIPGQRNFGCNRRLFEPFEMCLSKSSSPFNQIFAPYKNIHRDKEAILYATGPSLSLYDGLEDNGTRLKVGVNGIAKKNIELDYYFCGHVDTRSKQYLNSVSDLQVSGAKFGFISLDGISGPQWLSLAKAKELGLKPYSLTTEIDFTRDISTFACVNHLIIFSAIQFLIYTGVKRIYLVGSDATQLISDENHSLDKDRNVKRIKNIFAQLKNWANGKTEIISINPVGLRGIFPEIRRQDVSHLVDPPDPVPGIRPLPPGNQNKTIQDALGGAGGYQST